MSGDGYKIQIQESSSFASSTSLAWRSSGLPVSTTPPVSRVDSPRLCVWRRNMWGRSTFSLTTWPWIRLPCSSCSWIQQQRPWQLLPSWKRKDYLKFFQIYFFFFSGSFYILNRCFLATSKKTTAKFSSSSCPWAGQFTRLAKVLVNCSSARYASNLLT